MSVDEPVEVDVSDVHAEATVLRAGLTTTHDVCRVVGPGERSGLATLAGIVVSVVSLSSPSKLSVLVTGRECALVSWRRTAQRRSPHSSERNTFFGLKVFATTA